MTITAAVLSLSIPAAPPEPALVTSVMVLHDPLPRRSQGPRKTPVPLSKSRSAAPSSPNAHRVPSARSRYQKTPSGMAFKFQGKASRSLFARRSRVLTAPFQVFPVPSRFRRGIAFRSTFHGVPFVRSKRLDQQERSGRKVAALHCQPKIRELASVRVGAFVGGHSEVLKREPFVENGLLPFLLPNWAARPRPG
jgi:hypothetical protein